VYAPPSHQGFQLFFVRGDGSLILQIHPQRPTARTDIPTCLNRAVSLSPILYPILALTG
jgi:hypothetical protein